MSTQTTQKGGTDMRGSQKPPVATPLKVQANWRILEELKDWVDEEARKRGRRPAHVVEDIIRAVKEA